jgi:ankyrin repeat protein
LFIASKAGYSDVVECLLRADADINWVDILGQSPLFAASMSGHCDVVKCLLSSDADINLCDKDGHSPLFEASMSGHYDVVKCLLSSGANINLCSKSVVFSKICLTISKWPFSTARQWRCGIIISTKKITKK